MAYPSSIDVIAPVVTGNAITAPFTNSLVTAILAIENTVGINPQGGYSTVAAALAAVVAPSNLFLAKNFT